MVWIQFFKQRMQITALSFIAVKKKLCLNLGDYSVPGDTLWKCFTTPIAGINCFTIMHTTKIAGNNEDCFNQHIIADG